MRFSKPPAFATWLLEHFRPGSEGDHIAGDLMESYQCGRSRTWYWKEVLAAIVIGACDEITAHPLLALRAISIGWVAWFLFDYGVGPLTAPIVRRFVIFRGYPFGPSMLIWFTASLFVRAASGWIVARLHRSHRVAMVLLFSASVFIVQLRTLPWIWRTAANTLTNTRFLPYLIYSLELQFLWPAAILFGGLYFGKPRIETMQPPELGESHMKRKIRWFPLGSLLALAIALCALPALRNFRRASQVYIPGVNGVSNPSCAYCPNPKYSKKARDAKYEGTVLVQAVVTQDGHATKIQVLEGPGQGLGVEDTAVEVLQRWKFHPASGPTGTPVAVQVPIHVEFHLSASE